MPMAPQPRWVIVNETQAIKAALGDHAKKVVVNSTKSMTGHLLGGLAELSLSLPFWRYTTRRVRRRSIFSTRTPSAILTTAPMSARDMRIDVAVKNNFGFGGTNGSLVFKRV
jgi:3-oxoacyl-[acyl-carrier-protein] synthase II